MKYKSVRVKTPTYIRIKRLAIELDMPITRLIDLLYDEHVRPGDQAAPPQLLTVREVAVEVRADARTVRRILRAGDLPYVDLGPRTKRVRRADLDAYLAANK